MDEYKKRIVAFRLAMNMADTMCKRGIITDADYEKIRRIMADKYGISPSSIFFI